jgi:WD40 repeat protein
MFNGTVHLWDLEAFRERPFPQVRVASGQYGAAFDPTSKRLIIVADTGLAEAWDITTGQRAFSFGGESHRQSSYDGLMALSSDGAWLASTHGRFFTLRDQASSNILLRFPEEQAVLYSFAWSPNRELLAVGSSEGGLAIWNFGKIKARLDEIGLGW